MNCIIIHGCHDDKNDTNFNKHWIPWLKEQLTAKGIKTETPVMPEPWIPNYEKFRQEFKKLEVDENTILVGHSCGCAFLVRYLGESKRQVKKLILVAPWKIPQEENQAEFYSYEIDESIKQRVKEIIVFTSDNEHEDGKKSLRIFQNTLGGTVVNIPNHGHFTEDDMGTVEFPELLNYITS